MEELENRAQIKHQDNYTGKIISGLDDTLLSGGEGAKRELLEFEKETVESSGSLFSEIFSITREIGSPINVSVLTGVLEISEKLLQPGPGCSLSHQP